MGGVNMSQMEPNMKDKGAIFYPFQDFKEAGFTYCVNKLSIRLLCCKYSISRWCLDVRNGMEL
jgi:hypothetical protein